MRKYFGTDGIRGIANKELTVELAYKVGKAGAYVLSKSLKDKPKILVAKDTRLSCDMIESALVAGFLEVGAEVELVGVVPTPAIAYLIRKYGADAGVVISASHNSFEFNGIKYFNNKGFKLPDEVELQIETLIDENCKSIPVTTQEKIGIYKILKNAKNDYIEMLKNTVDFKNCNIKVGIDCANGATFEVAPIIFNELGIEYKVINNTPNGININKDCGSTKMEGLKKFVIENKLDIGLAFDGDGDRVLAVDENGKLIDGDIILAIIGKYLKENNKLLNNTIVATVMSNIGLSIFGESNNIKIEKSKVGDRYVLEEMLKSGHCLGGEQSGHVIFLTHNTTGDGILTGLQLINIMVNKNKKISELAEIIDVYPQVLVNAKINNAKKTEYQDDNIISSKIIELEKDLKDQGRILIRPSGTEPLVRVMIEGKDINYINHKANELAKLIEERLN